jgi:hypothetical protein
MARMNTKKSMHFMIRVHSLPRDHGSAKDVEVRIPQHDYTGH